MDEQQLEMALDEVLEECNQVEGNEYSSNIIFQPLPEARFLYDILVERKIMIRVKNGYKFNRRNAEYL